MAKGQRALTNIHKILDYVQKSSTEISGRALLQSPYGFCAKKHFDSIGLLCDLHVFLLLGPVFLKAAKLDPVLQPILLVKQHFKFLTLNSLAWYKSGLTN